MKYALLLCALIHSSFCWSVSYRDIEQGLTMPEAKSSATAFAAGMVNGFGAANSLARSNNDKPLYCAPPKLVQSSALVIQQTEAHFEYLIERGRDRSELGGMLYSILALDAMQTAFPCD